MISGKRNIDYRLVLIGAMLPDLVDKPLGHIILPENNGRIFAHTLLFAIFFASLSVVSLKMAPLAYGVAFHGLIDSTFTDPRATLWPFMGGFEATQFQVVDWVESLFDPAVIGWEVLGLISLISFLKWGGLTRTGSVIRFLRSGSAAESKT